MLLATLCSTNNTEPWAANVNFEVNGLIWIVKLNSKYAHYKNLLENNKVVVVYKTPNFEIIAKGEAALTEPSLEDISVASITINWLRLVENNNTNDYTERSDIERILSEVLA